jgi:hypothetical protein
MLSSSDDEAEAAGSKSGIDSEKQSPQNYHREEAAKGHRRVRSLKVDLVVPSRREVQTVCGSPRFTFPMSLIC